MSAVGFQPGTVHIVFSILHSLVVHVPQTQLSDKQYAWMAECVSV